jgi:hypothetical protein
VSPIALSRTLTTLEFCCATTMLLPGREVQAEWPGTTQPTARTAIPC